MLFCAVVDAIAPALDVAEPGVVFLLHPAFLVNVSSSLVDLSAATAMDQGCAPLLAASISSSRDNLEHHAAAMPVLAIEIAASGGVTVKISLRVPKQS
jgi:hypothetical protein